jgi:hypothetical protein
MVKAVFGVSELAKLGETIYLAFETAQGGEPGPVVVQLGGGADEPGGVDVAHDPFFGRVGQVMAVSQLQQALKFELLIPYTRPRNRPPA